MKTWNRTRLIWGRDPPTDGEMGRGEKDKKRKTDICIIHANTFDTEYVKVTVCYPVD